MSQTDDKLDKINSQLDQINRKLDPPMDNGTRFFDGIMRGLRFIGRPIRGILPYRVNRIIDHVAAITFLICIVFIFTDGWYGFTSVGNCIVVIAICAFIFASSPFHDDKK